MVGLLLGYHLRTCTLHCPYYLIVVSIKRLQEVQGTSHKMKTPSYKCLHPRVFFADTLREL